MVYCTKADLLEQIGEARLIELTDDAATGVVDDTKVDRAIADAGEEIDGHLGMRLSLPVAQVPPLVRKWAVDIAIYNLCSRREAEVPEARIKRHEAARADLRRFAEGKLSLGVNDPDEPPSDAGKPQISSATRVFDRDKLGGF